MKKSKWFGSLLVILLMFVLASCTLWMPKFEGKVLLFFAAEDLDGNEVFPNEIISGNKVTMVNVWATYCGPCLSEMPSLEKLFQKYKDQGFGIIGVTNDVLDGYGKMNQKQLENAKAIISQTGVTYPILIETPEMMQTLRTSVVPTTWFLDADGMVIKGPVYGSTTEKHWEEIIVPLLTEEKQQ